VTLSYTQPVTSSALLDPQDWEGRGFGGDWQPLDRTADVIEPATGDTLATIGMASPASGQLRKVSLELGGKNPLIVLDDVDLDAAVETTVWGTMLHQTVDAGGTLETGGTYSDLCYAPTVVSGVTREMPAYANEVFGPVAIVTTFASDDEAVALANDTEDGLAAAVMGGDLARAMAIGDRLHAGLVHVSRSGAAHQGR
jgi:acyl-CoA reductase-like NAD-dependent aldehyde dehydrogenase